MHTFIKQRVFKMSKEFKFCDDPMLREIYEQAMIDYKPLFGRGLWSVKSEDQMTSATVSEIAEAGLKMYKPPKDVSITKPKESKASNAKPKIKKARKVKSLSIEDNERIDNSNGYIKDIKLKRKSSRKVAKEKAERIRHPDDYKTFVSNLSFSK